MIKDKIELCDGIVAIYDEERTMYKAVVHWLGRDIEVWVSSDPYESEEELNYSIKTFERFWLDRDKYLKMGQDDIRDKLLPYIAEHEAPNGILPYPKVSPDGFDSEYWLTSVYIIALENFYTDVQLNFNKEDDEFGDSELSVKRDLNTGDVEYTASFEPITIE